MDCHSAWLQNQEIFQAGYEAWANRLSEPESWREPYLHCTAPRFYGTSSGAASSSASKLKISRVSGAKSAGTRSWCNAW